ncbi:LTA synthase family protein [Lactobacillus corticis]|uniref:Alkaline phosphatase n=1 Tax=Lactobacillus corticis TaxID=2201249 RepID=A0A916QKE9_9LACO|nr:LTA synthase family protein [Lactobacillus corticis]GFZ27498.1 alkaline phosphatase [Lactobacillus corticis]
MSRLKRGLGWLTQTRAGFLTIMVLSYWLKTYLIYQTKFNLGATGAMQQFLLFINPLPSALLLLGVGMFFKGRKAYWITWIIDLLLTTWLFANILYYREFSNFLSISIIKTSGSTSENLGKSIVGILLPTDFLAYLDVLIILLLLSFKLIKMETHAWRLRWKMLVEVVALLLMGVNLLLAQHDRSGLLTRTFDNNYIVKYLGINEYAVYDGVKTAKSSAQMARANVSDIKAVKNYLKANYVKPNSQYTGVAKGKNVLIIHLESFQQFLIDYKYKGKYVTPNLNKIYHSKNSLSFDNFFNQVGQGKTSDAEMMLENSLFGLQSGSAMSTYGTTNTFESAPAILSQKLGYTTAVMHGGTASFWNRNNAYKSFGYDYFFSLNYYKNKADYSIGYGLKDKIFFKESVPFLERLPQPFYLKMITVTNHYPYQLDKPNQTISKTKTGDETVDGYVQTAHYLDQAVGELMKYLKKTGLLKNTMLVFYGDHYGISGNHHAASAELLGQKTFNDFDNVQFQRVPLIINMKGLKGEINHTYGGEIDVLPTLLNLLGVSNKGMIQFGHDLLSKQAPQIVAQRNGDFITPTYTKVDGGYYDTKTGEKLTKLSKKQKRELSTINNKVTTELSLSDRVIEGNLLRFYKPKWFKYVKTSDYSYNKTEALKKLLKDKTTTSLYARNKDKSTAKDYKTDAPELKK